VPAGGFFSVSQIGIFNSITQDAEGQIWFTETASGEVGRLNPITNIIEEFTKPGIRNPAGIATTGAGPTL
jgi:streptogramin lyase